MVEAPGWPGIPARWTSSAKDGVGAALTQGSQVWFTISHGIVNEIYYPRVDQACVRDVGLIVTDGGAFFAEVKRDCDTLVERIEDGVPAFRLTSTHRGGRFRLINQVIADPRSDSILLHIRLENSSKTALRLFALLAPHLVNAGAHNNGKRSEYKGRHILSAVGDGTHLTMLGSPSFLASSVGFVGASDGWRQLRDHGRLIDQYDTATDGNIALSAELAMGADGGSVLAVGFGRTSAEGAYHARTSSMSPFETILNDYSAGWRAWQSGLRTMERRAHGQNMYRVSANILRVHQTPTFPGGFIASLSIPWGFSKGDDDMGGYHLIWPRDLCETAGGLLACGAHSEVRQILRYLRATQEGDGSWRQNYWLDGAPYWGGVQLDECAFPMLLLDMARREGALGLPDLQQFWPMVERAAGFVLRTGPRTKQDRWEENAGYTPFTLAVAIAALLAAAEIAEACDIEALPALLRDTADAWNEQIEDWIYVEDTPLAREAGVPGYYIRVAPESPAKGGPDVHGLIQVRNHEAGSGAIAADELISTDAIALVRFGLRAPDDPRMLSTIAVIDRLLKVELPQGPGWHRYNLDGYGEKADGSPFDGVGIGRAWPLLAGERAHYALAAGRRGGGGSAARDDRGADQSRRPHSRAGVGRGAHSRKGPSARQADRLGDAPRLGACGICEAVALARRRQGVRPAPSHSAPLPRQDPECALPAVARGLPDGRRPLRTEPAARSGRGVDRPLHARRLEDPGRRRDERHSPRPAYRGTPDGGNGGRRQARLHLAPKSRRGLARAGF